MVCVEEVYFDDVKDVDYLFIREFIVFDEYCFDGENQDYFFG